MKFFEIDEEYLKKGGLITRDKKSGISFGVVNGCLVAFNNGIKKEPEEVFKGYIGDLLASDWEYISYDSKKPIWKPEDDEKYYYINSNVAVDWDYYCSNYDDDELRIRIGNVFKTEEEAEKMIKKLQIINTLKELSNIDFNDSNSDKYVIYYSTNYNNIMINKHSIVKELPFNIYFKTKEDCQKAIDTIGEENLKKYYFDVVE